MDYLLTRSLSFFSRFFVVCFAVGITSAVYAAAQSDQRFIPADTPIVVDVLANDGAGDNARLIAFTQPANGTVTEGAGGGLRYTPTAGFAGIDRFRYTLEDADGNRSSAQVAISVGSAIPGFMALANLAAAMPRVLDETRRAHTSSIQRFIGAKTTATQLASNALVLGGGAGDGLLPAGGVFLSFDYRQGEHDAVAGLEGFDNRSFSTTLGADFLAYKHATLGVALGLSDANVELALSDEALDALAASFIAFGSWNTEAWSIEAQAGFTSATTEVQGFADEDLAIDGDANSQFVMAKGQWFWRLKGWDITPSVGLEWQRTENQFDSLVTLSSDANTIINAPLETDAWQWLAGINMAYPMGFSWGVLMPQLNLHYERRLQSEVTGGLAHQGSITGASIGETLFVDDQQWVIDAGAAAILPHGWQGFANVQALTAHSHYQSLAFYAGLRKEF